MRLSSEGTYQHSEGINTIMARVEKAQFRNTTQGWIGAVSIGPKGDEIGVAVEAGGTVWLSEEEQILTANAPRDPADNPFIEQTHIVQDPQSGERREVKVTPLVQVNENRYVPANTRPIPSDIAAANAAGVTQDAATAEEPSVPTTLEAGALQRHAEVAEIGQDAKPHQPPPVPRSAALAAAAAADAAEEEPSAPAEPPYAPPTPAAPTPPAADPTHIAPPDEGRVSEETAAVSPGPASEETGAAVSPTGQAPEGGFQSGEEVGTPQAPATETAAQQPPAPAPLTEE